MHPWISGTLDFWFQFCEKSAAYAWTFMVLLSNSDLCILKEVGAKVSKFMNWAKMIKMRQMAIPYIALNEHNEQ